MNFSIKVVERIPINNPPRIKREKVNNADIDLIICNKILHLTEDGAVKSDEKGVYSFENVNIADNENFSIKISKEGYNTIELVLLSKDGKSQIKSVKGFEAGKTYILSAGGPVEVSLVKWFDTQRPITKGNKIEIYRDGQDVFKSIYDSFNDAEEYIYIASWDLDPDLVLIKEYVSNSKYYLKEILKKKRKEGVEVKVLVWDTGNISEDLEEKIKQLKDDALEGFLNQFKEEIVRVIPQRLDKLIQTIEEYPELSFIEKNVLRYAIIPKIVGSDLVRKLLINMKEEIAIEVKKQVNDKFNENFDKLTQKKVTNLNQYKIDVVLEPHKAKIVLPISQDGFKETLSFAIECMITCEWILNPVCDYLSKEIYSYVNDELKKDVSYELIFKIWKPEIKEILKESLKATLNNYNIMSKVIKLLPSEHSFGSHHQKIAIVDGKIGFCNGGNFNENAWDTPEHIIDDIRRSSKDLRHDIFCKIEGPAVECLQNNFVERWESIDGCLSPKSVHTDLGELQVQVDRTFHKEYGDVKEIMETYIRAISNAQKYIYFENQYFTSKEITESLINSIKRAKAEGRKLKIIFVLPEKPEDFIAPLIYLKQYYFLCKISKHLDHDFLYFIYNKNSNIYVHSKLTIIDDIWLTMGSANTTDRSMKFDSEINICTLDQEFVRKFRTELWAEHLQENKIPDDPIEAIKLWEKKADEKFKNRNISSRVFPIKIQSICEIKKYFGSTLNKIEQIPPWLI